MVTDTQATTIESPLHLNVFPPRQSGTLTAPPTPAGIDWTPYTDNGRDVHLLVGMNQDLDEYNPEPFLRELDDTVTGGLGIPFPQLRMWPDGRDWHIEFYAVAPDFGDEPTITLSMTVEHEYELYGPVTAYVVDAVVPAPPADEDSDEYDEWRQAYIIDAFTGVGRPDGDSWYDLTVTACSDPELVGHTFDWGY